MIKELYDQCFSLDYSDIKVPMGLTTPPKLKDDMQVVFKGNKGWLFDYHNSVLYTLSQLGALFVYALMQDKSYEDIVKSISNYYDINSYIVDSDIQSFLVSMHKKDLLKIGSI